MPCPDREEGNVQAALTGQIHRSQSNCVMIRVAVAVERSQQQITGHCLGPQDRSDLVSTVGNPAVGKSAPNDSLDPGRRETFQGGEKFAMPSIGETGFGEGSLTIGHRHHDDRDAVA